MNEKSGREGQWGRKVFIILPFFLLLPNIPSFSQDIEFGPMLGGSYYIGELNPYQHFGEATHLAGGGVLRYTLNKRYSIKFGLLHGTVSGDDTRARNQWRKERNLHFKSPLTEASATIELNFLEYALGSMDDPYSPYLFAGLSLFRMNPKAKYDGEWHDLQPLGTEGQGTDAKKGTDKYSLTNMALPFGVGFKANLTPRVALSFEWGFRKTYTDHLDDVSGTYASPDILREENGPLAAKLADRREKADNRGKIAGQQRGNPKRKDWYSFSGVMVTFMLGEKPSVCNSAVYH